MVIVIVGGGKLGFDLAQTMMERKYDVRLIEKNKLKCMDLANQLDAEVICGDGTEIEILAEAGAKNCDSFIAVTGSDQDNLVATQLAKKEFGAKKVIVRANNPANMEALRTLGTDIVVSSTEIITKLIEQEVDFAEMHMLATLNKGRASICTMILPDRSAWDGHPLKDIDLPSGSLVISILRDEAMMIPNGYTVLHSGDELVAVCENDNRKKLIKLFGEKR
ncbi:MAG: TrkA family potassium uptake protein [Oscillospiraceae bacterium]|nr:TrkA family potassium uptake protein [Oscillospiraceae bacterium]